MKKCLAIAVLLLASTAPRRPSTPSSMAAAPLRIDPDRGTVSDSRRLRQYRQEGQALARRGRRSRSSAQEGAAAGEDRSAGRTRGRAAAPRLHRLNRLPLRRLPRRAPAPAAPATASTAEPSTTTAAVAPADTAAPAPPAAPQPLRPHAGACSRCRAGATAAATETGRRPGNFGTVQAANSPLGVWLTEEKEGKVRIEQCGANLCGYSVDKKSNQNGEQVLINMKPGKDKWSGRIFDPNTGSTYDSTIALKGTDSLRVQGCAFGGMFCGGQTWTRVN